MLGLTDQELVTIIIAMIIGGCIIMLVLAIIMMIVEQPFQRLQAIQKLIKDWDTKQGHSKCWYYPEIFRSIAAHAKVKLINNQPDVPRQQFREQCHAYEDEVYQSKQNRPITNSGDTQIME